MPGIGSGGNNRHQFGRQFAASVDLDRVLDGDEFRVQQICVRKTTHPLRASFPQIAGGAAADALG
eukprot:CAMPEP_0174892530 /NCGR_PEP_ID=MMETSP0167-20121228/7462_1 /TAXON_ID=38298 /ORGANISM="Rhodella maculata, Strain CCMP736" /LENGTH=64 /DNA_ID=CAMNT_0016131043 /DNA_START=562 /DNA_END=756 /DNA_ORIENTATION=-